MIERDGTEHTTSEAPQQDGPPDWIGAQRAPDPGQDPRLTGQWPSHEEDGSPAPGRTPAAAELSRPGDRDPAAPVPPGWQPITDPQDERLTDRPPLPVDGQGKPMSNPFEGSGVDPYAPRPGGEAHRPVIEHLEGQPQTPWTPEDNPAAQQLLDELDRIRAAEEEQLQRPAANVSPDGAPHFELVRTNEDGSVSSAVCGQDGQPWPCPAYQELQRTATEQESPAEPEDTRVMREAAAAAGIDFDEFMARQRDQR